MDKQKLVSALNAISIQALPQIKALTYEDLALKIEEYKLLLRLSMTEQYNRDLERIKVDPTYVPTSSILDASDWQAPQPKPTREKKQKASKSGNSVAEKQDRFKELMGISIGDLTKHLKASQASQASNGEKK